MSKKRILVLGIAVILLIIPKVLEKSMVLPKALSVGLYGAALIFLIISMILGDKNK